MSTTTETRAALDLAIRRATSLYELDAALIAHEAAVRAEAVAEVIEFLDSQTGPVASCARIAARAVQLWADSRAARIEQEASK